MEIYKLESNNQKLQLDRIRKELDQMLKDCQNSSVSSRLEQSNRLINLLIKQ